MFAILFFIEFLLHRLSRVIRYASTISAQIRLMLTDVSQRFCSVSQEFILSSNETDSRHYGIGYITGDQECREDGECDDDHNCEVRRNGHAYLNYPVDQVRQNPV